MKVHVLFSIVKNLKKETFFTFLEPTLIHDDLHLLPSPSLARTVLVSRISKNYFKENRHDETITFPHPPKKWK